MCERLAYYGIATNIITYLTGKLGQSNSSSAAAVNAWSGTCYVTPLLGAFIADAYWGRYWVILVFSLIYMGGLGMLSASAGDSSLHPPAGEAATGSQLGFFWAAMCVSELHWLPLLLPLLLSQLLVLPLLLPLPLVQAFH
jgi:peptide/histidine transporter 3/4